VVKTWAKMVATNVGKRLVAKTKSLHTHTNTHPTHCLPINAYYIYLHISPENQGLTKILPVSSLTHIHTHHTATTSTIPKKCPEQKTNPRPFKRKNSEHSSGPVSVWKRSSTHQASPRKAVAMWSAYTQDSAATLRRETHSHWTSLTTESTVVGGDLRAVGSKAHRALFGDFVVSSTTWTGISD
jgi:hypothetical protein